MNTRGSPQTDLPGASLRRGSRFSLANLPIKHRLPLLIGTLLFGIITVSIWASYRGVRESALEVGGERLRNLTQQLANQTQQSLPISLNRTFTAANDPAVRAFFRAPSTNTRLGAVSVLQQFGPVQDPSSAQVELWNATGSPVLTVPDNSSPQPSDLSVEFKQSGVDPYKTVGPIRVVKDVLIYTVVVAAKDDQGKVIGYLVRWRLVSPTPNARKQLSDLLGSEATLYYGNSKGDLFTDLEKTVPRPPVGLSQTLEVTHYTRDGNPVMAMGRPIGGTPWFLLVEFPERTFLIQAHKFLRRILMIGIVLLGCGVVGAFALTRSITRPLRSITATAAAIGDGDYSAVVPVRRTDELGQLANAFNHMLVKVRDTQRELQRDLSERTARLEAAPSAMLMVDERGRMTLVNAQLEQLFGYDRSELLDQPVEMLVPKRYRNVHSGHRVNFFHSPSTRVMGAGRDLFGLRKDGTEVPIEIGLNPIRTDKGAFVLASIIDITERKRAEERFRLVVEASPSAMIMVNAQGRITLVNTQTENLFGYSRAELLGQPMEMLVPERYRGAHPGHRAGFFQAPSSRAMGAGRDLFGRRKDGAEVPIEIGLNPIKTDEGAFVLASIIDITERRRAEERFRLVVEASPSAMIMVDAEGRITLVNTQTEKLFGYGRAELLGQGLEMLVPERYRAGHPGHRRGFFRTPSTRSMGVGRDLFGLRKDGSEMPIEIGLNPINTDEGAFVLASIIDITERKRAEERFRQVIEGAPNGMVMVGREGKIALVNLQIEKSFGYSRDELLGQPIEMLVPERFRGHHLGYRNGFMAEPSTRSMGSGRDLYGLRKDGSEFPVEIGLNPIETERGLMVLGTIVDITERKQAEENVRRSQEQLAGVIESAMDAIITVDEGQRIVLFNSAAERMFLYRSGEAIGQPLDRFIPARFHAVHQGHIEDFGRTHVTKRAMGNLAAIFGLRADGEEFPIEASISQIDVAGQKLFTVILRDITDRKQAELAAARLSAIVESSSDAIVGKDLQSNVTSWNAGAERMFGFAAHEIVGQSITRLIPKDRLDEEEKVLERVRLGESIEHFQTQRLRKNGELIDVSVTISPIKDAEGQVIGASKVARDITEQKRTEEARRATEARYRTLFENAPDGIVIADTESYYLDANESICRMLGYTRAEMIGLHASDIVSESEVQHVGPALGTIKAKDDYHREWQFKRKDGSFFAAEVIATMMPDGNLLGMIRDITERKEADEKLRKSEEQLAGVIGSAMDAIITVDQEQRIVLFNTAAERAFLFPAEDAIGQPLDRFIPERFRAGHQRHVDDFGKTHVTRRSMGTLGALYGLRADGEEFPLEASISQVESDGRKLYTVILRDVTERKRAEEALKEHARILDLAPVLIRDLKGRILFWNTGAEQMYGWKSEEALEKMTHQLFQTEFPRSPEEIRARLLARGHWEGELVHTRKDGERIVVASHWVLHRDENDKPKAILELNNDITERKQTEKALRESEERLHLAVRSTKLGTWEQIVETGERLWSDQSKAIFGFPPGADVNVENLAQLVHPDDRKRTDEALKRALQPEGDGELHTECRILIGGGKVERWIESRGRVIFESGRAVRIIGTLLDITDRKQAEEALRESEERLRLGIQAAELGTWDYRFNTGEVFFDERGARNFGFTSLATTFDHAVARIFPDDRERVTKAADQALKGENDGMYEQEFRVFWPDNSIHWLAAYGRAHFEGAGENRRAIRFIGINMDITERKQAEKEIHRLNEELEQRVADRTAQLQAVNKELEAFSYSVSHDLRAPLRHIDGFSQALLEDYQDKLDEAGKGYLREVRSASQEMAQLIDDVLQLARVTRSEMRREVVNLSDLARSIAAELKKREPKRKVHLNLKEELTTRGDKRLLRIVLNNLLGNAWKFTSNRTDGQITFGREQKNGDTTYFIRDNGAGFDMAYVGKLFGAFQRLHTAGEFEGTGIGLATVQRIVSRHGGRVWAEGAVNVGATFYFTLPKSKETGDELQSDLTG